MKKIRKVWNQAELEGQRFGKLLVLHFERKKYPKSKSAIRIWVCQCDCGKITTCKTARLRNGHKRSCGCLVKKHAHNWLGVGEISCAYYTIIRRNAASRGLEFSISLQEMWDLFIKQDRKCALTDVELTFTSNYRDYKKMQTASLDRINSDKGYTLDNVQWVHKKVNIIKRDVDQQYFIEMCKKIAKKFNNENTDK